MGLFAPSPSPPEADGAGSVLTALLAVALPILAWLVFVFRSLLSRIEQLEENEEQHTRALGWVKAGVMKEMALLAAVETAHADMSSDYADAELAVLTGAQAALQGQLSGHVDGQAAAAKLKTVARRGELVQVMALIKRTPELGRSHEPLHSAAEGGHAAVIDVLLVAAANANALSVIDQQSRSGETALMCAASEAQADACERLLRAGADATVQDADGYTAAKHCEESDAPAAQKAACAAVFKRWGVVRQLEHQLSVERVRESFAQETVASKAKAQPRSAPPVPRRRGGGQGGF